MCCLHDQGGWKAAEAHRVGKGKLEGGGIPLYPKLGTLRRLRQAGGLQLVESGWGRLGGLVLHAGSRHATEGEGDKGNS